MVFINHINHKETKSNPNHKSLGDSSPLCSMYTNKE
jgi:hypothetical protein